MRLFPLAAFLMFAAIIAAMAPAYVSAFNRATDTIAHAGVH